MKFSIFSAFLLVLLVSQSSGELDWFGCHPDFVETYGVTTGAVINTVKITRESIGGPVYVLTIGPPSVISFKFFFGPNSKRFFFIFIGSNTDNWHQSNPHLQKVKSIDSEWWSWNKHSFFENR